MIKNNVEKFLKNNLSGISCNTYIVAFSGGADSMCLLDVLSDLSLANGFSVAAAHLNHGWRAEESDFEELRAKKFCEGRNIPFYSEKLPSDIPHTETEARTQRYLFFERAAKVFDSKCIFTAHTASDQVETVLYRFIKGTGVSGLKGIPSVRSQADGLTYYRPLLGIGRLRIEEYCNAKNLLFSTDSSNADIKYARNRIRHELIPALKTYNKGFDDAVMRLSVLAGDYDELSKLYLDKIKKEIALSSEVYDTDLFLKLPLSARRLLVFDLLSSNVVEFGFEKVVETLFFIEGASILPSGNTYSLAENLWLFVSTKEIKLINSTKANVIKSSVKILLNENGKEYFYKELNKTLVVRQWVEGIPTSFPKENSPVVYVDVSGFYEFELRTRQSGDVIQPFGMREKTKLKKYLINRGIPQHIRDELTLLAKGNEILWVAGVGVSEQLRVKTVPTHILELK